MITQRAIEEGQAMEKGKTTPEYFEACSIVEMNPEDMKKLGIWKNTNVRVTSEAGSVVLKQLSPPSTAHPALHISDRGYGLTKWSHQGLSQRGSRNTADSRSPSSLQSMRRSRVPSNSFRVLSDSGKEGTHNAEIDHPGRVPVLRIIL